MGEREGRLQGGNETPSRRVDGDGRRLGLALVLSLALHVLFISLTFGDADVGLPGLSFFWKERRVEVSPLRVELAPPPAPAAVLHEVPVRATVERARVARPVLRPIVAPVAPPPRAVAEPAVTTIAMVKPEPEAAPQPEVMAAPPAPPAPVAEPAAKPADPELPVREAAMPKLDVPEREPAPEDLTAAKLEAARVEAEAEMKEAARREAERLDAERREAERLAAERRAAEAEARRQEAARQDAARIEAQRLEAQRLEAERQETARQEAVGREAARLEAERRAAALEAQRLEAARREAARLEAERREAARLEAERQEALRLEAARLAAAREEEERREARLRAIGRQLDEEARQREAGPNLPYSLSTARRLRLWGRSDPNEELVKYAEAWARRIQLNTPVETVRELAQRPHGDPMVTVAIRSDGSVESVTIVHSSGVAEIDAAIRNIVQSQAPYQAFPPGLARHADVIEVRRTWYFDVAIRLN
ncbi:MAG: TonB family protein [Rhodocyclales bacterium]|nr:TonB family protein [Rhodocyclales bacterium]